MILGTEKIKDAKELMNQIFCMEKIVTYNIGYLENLVTCINSNVINYLINIIQEDEKVLKNQFSKITSIYNFREVQHYFDALIKCIVNANEYIINLKGNHRVNNELQEAVQYINQNYHRNISMTMVANHISLTYSYFSYLFKENTGLSFVDYLRKVRIDNALHMLKNTDLRILEVGEKVGFPNSKHFSKTFKSVTGISPAEYREKLHFD